MPLATSNARNATPEAISAGFINRPTGVGTIGENDLGPEPQEAPGELGPEAARRPTFQSTL